MRRAAMQDTVIIGSTVRCGDGTTSSVGGLIINPNRSHVDYVILNFGGPGGREYFVPSAQFKGANVSNLPCTSAELDQFPHPEHQSRQGTVQDNLSDLVVAGEQTLVRDAQGGEIGRLYGVIVDPAFEIQA